MTPPLGKSAAVPPTILPAGGTNYNDERFFVRQAYFLGKDDDYDPLKRALRSEINEAMWDALYSSRSLPFDRPATGRIAVKVINHYGD
jgi:adenine-specific DNA-methyltransferase